MSDFISIWAGADIGKDFVDVCRCEGEQAQHQRIRRQSKALQKLAAWLQAQQVEGVVLEASGGYEQLVVEQLQAAGLAVAVVNPKRVRDFAKAAGLLAKTDRVDAYALALFGRRMRPRRTAPLGASHKQLRGLLRRQQQLVQLRAGERTRLGHDNNLCADSCVRLIEALSQEIERIEAEIRSLIDRSEPFQLRQSVLLSAPGVGKTTSWTLLAQLPELGALDAKQIASLAGLAPFAHDSGRHRGQRRIRGGRKLVRQMLYMAARTAVRTDLGWRSFYEGLLARGKLKRVALTAVARRLLVVLNAMARDLRPWESSALSESSS